MSASEPRETRSWLWFVLVAAAMFLTSAVVAVVFVLHTVASFDYGADFDYPPALEVPEGVGLVESDTGWDDDDPMRIRVQVIDAPGISQGQLATSYGEGLTEADGWRQRRPKGAVLCMVNDSREDYRQVIEVWPYVGHRVAPKADRYLVMSTRFAPRWGAPCGEAGGWIPSDLIQ